jgi:hypothetical protein
VIVGSDAAPKWASPDEEMAVSVGVAKARAEQRRPPKDIHVAGDHLPRGREAREHRRQPAAS